MMKQISIYLLIALISSIGYAQQVLVQDFENTSTFTTPISDNGLIASLEAAPEGENGISLKLESQASGAPWQAGIFNQLLDFIELTSDKTVEVDVYADQAFNLFLKVEQGGPNSAASESYTTPNSWQTLTFTFTEALDGTTTANGIYELLAFFPNWNASDSGFNSPQDFTVYVDNIKSATPALDPTTDARLASLEIDNANLPGFSPNQISYTYGVQASSNLIPEITLANPVNPNATSTVTQATQVPGDATVLVTAEDGTTTTTYTVSYFSEGPLTAAPTPPARPAEDVLSIFSDAYQNIGVDTFDTEWCAATTTEVLVEGNPTNKVTGLGCEGIDWQSSRTIDASEFTHYHLDIWTDSDTFDNSFNVKFSNWAGGEGEANAIEFSATNASTPPLPSENPGTWISFDFELSNFSDAGTGSTSIADIVQFVITSNLGTVYYDNLYLHKNTLGSPTFNTAEFKTFPNPTNGVWNIQTTERIKKVQIFNMTGSLVREVNVIGNTVEINANDLSEGLYFAKVSNEFNQSKTIKLIKN